MHPRIYLARDQNEQGTRSKIDAAFPVSRSDLSASMESRVEKELVAPRGATHRIDRMVQGNDYLCRLDHSVYLSEEAYSVAKLPQANYGPA